MTQPLADRLSQAVELAAKLLEANRVQLVLAESCTAGLVAASLARVPGISQFLCGSLVTYQESAKQAWLGVDSQLLAEHTAVSDEVTRRMARRALKMTPTANWSAAVTGHLGPGAPQAMDGVIFVSVVSGNAAAEADRSVRHQLDFSSRIERQSEAASLVLEELARALSSQG